MSAKVSITGLFCVKRRLWWMGNWEHGRTKEKGRHSLSQTPESECNDARHESLTSEKPPRISNEMLTCLGTTTDWKSSMRCGCFICQ